MDSTYWNNKLEKIQYALGYVQRIKLGEDIDMILAYLEKQEQKAVEDLIEAEQNE